MDQPILEVKHLKTYFKSKTAVSKAVDDVTFSLLPGETYGLVGESGCGKSTTCRSIMQIIHKPGEIVGGEIIFQGKDLLKMSPKELQTVRGKEISMIFQEPMTSLNPVLKIKEQIYENFKDKTMTRAQKKARAIELLRLVGIPMPEQRLNEYIHQFSGGMRQRVMIAITLAAEPKILLADEPTTALDVTIQDQIINLLNSLRQKLNMSIILITHDLGVVAQMCDYVAVMYAGHIVEQVDTVTLMSKPMHPYSDALLRSIPRGKREPGVRLESIEGTPPDLEEMPEGCPFAPRCKYATEICRRERPEMREYGNDHAVACHNVSALLADRGEEASE